MNCVDSLLGVEILTVIKAYDPIVYAIAIAIYVLARLFVIDKQRRIMVCIFAFILWFLAGLTVLLPVVIIPYNPWLPILMIPLGLAMMIDLVYQIGSRSQ